MAHRIDIPPEIQDYIIEHYQAGKPNRLLVEELGYSENRIYRLLEERGVKGVRFREPHTKFSPEQELEMKALYISGKSLSQVGKDFSCAHETVYKILLRHNTPMRSVGSQLKTYSDKQVLAMVEAWKGGESQRMIGERFGITQLQVSRILKMHGFTKDDRRASGDRHGHWKGGSVKAGNYIRVRIDRDDEFASMSDSSGYVLEHRLAMARTLGRPLAADETVHHIDGNGKNNDPSNLQLRQGNHGKGAHWQCGDCGSTNIIANALAKSP